MALQRVPFARTTSGVRRLYNLPQSPPSLCWRKQSNFRKHCSHWRCSCEFGALHRSAFHNQLQASGVQCPVSTAYAHQKLAAAMVSHQRAASLQRFLSLWTRVDFAHLSATPECPRRATSCVMTSHDLGWPNLHQTNVISNCAKQLRMWCALPAPCAWRHSVSSLPSLERAAGFRSGSSTSMGRSSSFLGSGTFTAALVLTFWRQLT